MNRAQRRANNEKAEMWTTAQVAAALKKDRVKLLQDMANDYSAVVAYTVRNHLKFGHKRTKGFLEAMEGVFLDVSEGVISIEDIKGVLDQEVGVRIK